MATSCPGRAYASATAARARGQQPGMTRRGAPNLLLGTSLRRGSAGVKPFHAEHWRDDGHGGGGHVFGHGSFAR